MVLLVEEGGSGVDDGSDIGPVAGSVGTAQSGDRFDPSLDVDTGYTTVLAGSDCFKRGV